MSSSPQNSIFWTVIATLHLHFPSLRRKIHFVATEKSEQLLYTTEGTLSRTRKGWKEVLDEEHLVFTGSGTGGGLLHSREGSNDWCKDHCWALRGIDGPVEALGTVVLHQRKSLTVVSIQAGAQRCLIIIAAPYEWFARYLSGSKTKRKKIISKKEVRHWNLSQVHV